MAFDFHSTTDDVLNEIDLAGRVAVVTGASSGLGTETVRALAANGASVIAAGRDQKTLEAALDGIRNQHKHARVEPLVLDLADVAACRDAASRLVASVDRIDMLINNAGVMCTPYGVTIDGFETQIGTNHLGHMAWTLPLLDVMTLTAQTHGDARIVNLSSAGHRFGDVDLEDLHYERRPYDPWDAYGQSKTANVLFSIELERRLGARGVHSVAVHPGGIHTNLGRHMTPEVRSALQDKIGVSNPGGFEWKTIEQGAATSVWAATTPNFAAAGGVYCEDCQVAAVDDAQNPTGEGVMSYAVDPDRATELWHVSERLLDRD